MDGMSPHTLFFNSSEDDTYFYNSFTMSFSVSDAISASTSCPSVEGSEATSTGFQTPVRASRLPLERDSLEDDSEITQDVSENNSYS